MRDRRTRREPEPTGDDPRRGRRSGSLTGRRVDGRGDPGRLEDLRTNGAVPLDRRPLSAVHVDTPGRDDRSVLSIPLPCTERSGGISVAARSVQRSTDALAPDAIPSAWEDPDPAGPGPVRWSRTGELIRRRAQGLGDDAATLALPRRNGSHVRHRPQRVLGTAPSAGDNVCASRWRQRQVTAP